MRLLITWLMLFVPVLAFGNACVSAGSGNWRSITWNTCGSTYPQTGDTFTVSTGNNVTIPGGESDTVTSGTTSGTGTLTITGTLTSGNLSGAVTISAGGTLHATSSAVIDTSTLTINGSSGSHATIDTVSGTATIGSSVATHGQVTATYADFTNISFINNLSSSGNTFSLANSTITNGNVTNYTIADGATFSLDTTSFVNPPSPSTVNVVEICINGCTTKTTGTRAFTNNWADDGMYCFHGTTGTDIGLQVDGNWWRVKSGSYAPFPICTNPPTYSGNNWGGTNGNFFYFYRASGSNNQYAYSPLGTLKNGYALAADRNCVADSGTGVVDNNLFEIVYPYSVTYDSWTWDITCPYAAAIISGANGGSAPYTVTADKNVVIGNNIGNGFGYTSAGLIVAVNTGCTQTGSGYCPTHNVTRATFASEFLQNGAYGLCTNHGTALFAGVCANIQNNLAWRAASGTGSIISFINTPLANNFFTNTDHNWTWNYSNGTAAYQDFGGAEYQNTPTIVGSNADPQFVDSTRNFINWCYHKGVTNSGNLWNDIDTCYAKAAIGTGTYDSAYTLSDLRTWVRGGFVPQNSATATAGTSSSQVGAMDYSAPAGGSMSISGVTLKGATVK